MSESIFRVELTSDQMHIIKMAVHDAARWYRQYGGGDQWYLRRESENLALIAYLDEQVPESSAVSNPLEK